MSRLSACSDVAYGSQSSSHTGTDSTPRAGPRFRHRNDRDGARPRGHRREIEVEHVGAVTARERPDVAFVGLGASSQHALGLIGKIVCEAACPVIVLLHEPDPRFVTEASKREVFAHISDDDVEGWQSSIDIVLRRFAEYHELEGAFGRRAQIERAKGILMERHAIDENRAFEMLRERSRIDNRRLIDRAAAVVDGHRLLPKHSQAPLPL